MKNDAAMGWATYLMTWRAFCWEVLFNKGTNCFWYFLFRCIACNLSRQNTQNKSWHMFTSWSSRWHHVLYNLNWTRVSCSFMHLNEYATIAAWVKACKEPLFIIQKMSSYKLAYNVINHSRIKIADIKFSRLTAEFSRFVLVLHIGDCQKDFS